MFQALLTYLCDREQIWLLNGNMCHMTFIFKPSLAVMKVNMHAENKDAASRHSKVILEDTYTHRKIPPKTEPAPLLQSVLKIVFLQLFSMRHT